MVDFQYWNELNVTLSCRDVSLRNGTTLNVRFCVLEAKKRNRCGAQMVSKEKFILIVLTGSRRFFRLRMRDTTKEQLAEKTAKLVNWQLQKAVIHTENIR